MLVDHLGANDAMAISNMVAVIPLMLLIFIIIIINGGSRGEQIRPWPPIEVDNGVNGVWPPSGAERVMIAL